MAEKLLQSIARGTYKATTEPVKQGASAAMRSTLDPIMFRSLYKAGIIGPLLKSIVSEYKKPEKKDSKGGTEVATDKVIVSNITRSLQSMSNQLSAIADVMEDIRDLTKVQLTIDQKNALQTQRMQRKGELTSIEEKIESVKPSTSGLIGSTQGQLKKGGFVGKFASSLLGFVADNPIISAIIGAGLLASSETIKKFVNDFREKSGIDQEIKKATATLKESVGSVVKEGLMSIEISLRDALADIVPFGLGESLRKGMPGDPTESRAPTTGGFDKGNVGGAALGFVLGRILLGRLGGLTGLIAGGTEASIGESLLGALGIMGAGALGGSLLKKGATKAGSAAVGATGSLLSGLFSRTKETVPTVSGIDVGKTQQKSLKDMTPLERSKVFASRAKPPESKISISKLVKMINKIGLGTVLPVMAAKAKIGLAGFAAGPIGIITTLVTVGYSLMTIYEWMKELEDAITEGVTGQSNTQPSQQIEPLGPLPYVEDATRTSPQSIRPIPAGSAPQLGDIGSESYEEYKNKLVRLESSGRNIPSATGGTAFGLFQITRKTFEDIKKLHPKEFSNVNFEDMQKDTNIQNRVFDLLTQDNRRTLIAKGIEPSAFNLYLAHRLGAGAAANILKAQDPNAPLIETAYAGSSFKFKSKVYNLNPDMQNKSVGRFLNERAVAFGGASAAPFAQAQAKPEKTMEDYLGDILGLTAFVKAAEFMRPITIMDNSTNTTQQQSSKTSSKSQSGQTILAFQPSKNDLRKDFGFNLPLGFN